MDNKNGGISPIRTIRTFVTTGGCADALHTVLNRAFAHPEADEQRAAGPLAGGLMQHGYQCGMIWGSTLAAGAEAFRRHGAGPLAQTKAILAARMLVEAFRLHNQGHADCYEITELNQASTTRQLVTYFLLKGGTVGCFRRAAEFAPSAFKAINAALATEDVEVPAMPVSCAAVLARKMGASDRHATMAAGLAGGIGLCGGACGALGAAIWLQGLSRLRDHGGKVEYKSAAALETVERFVRCADYEFECPRIVGRRFAGVADHASYLRDGGCAELLDVLAQ